MEPTAPLKVPDLARLQAFLMERREKPLFRRDVADTNLFGVLGLVHKEQADSMFLAWLLDPRGTHGQGSLFLSVFLDLCGLSDCSGYIDDPTCIVIPEFRGFEARVDIMVQVTSKFMLYVENKIGSCEGPQQTQREYRDLQRQGEARSIPEEYRKAVYLTPSGVSPEEETKGQWITLSHRELAESLRGVVRTVSDLRTRLLVEDWISMCDGSLTDMQFSECAMAVIEHWKGAWDVLLALDRFDSELALLCGQLNQDLRKQQWWTRGWRVLSDNPGQLFVGHTSWSIGRQPVIWIGLENFVCQNVLGPVAPAGLCVRVVRAQDELVGLLTTAIGEYDQQMIGEFDRSGGIVVRQLLPVCTQSNSTTYLRDVRDSTLEFVGHYAELFRRKEIDSLIRSAVRKAKTKK